jgi:hypothetical protein
MIDKKAALKCRQSPLQKAMGYAENALKIVGTVKGIYETGKELYNIGKAVAPAVEAGMALLM